MAVTPQLSWAQRKGQLYLTVEIVDPSDVKVEFQEKSIKISCSHEGTEYEVALNLHKEIKPQECRYAVNRKLQIYLEKKESQRWPSLTEGQRLSYVKVDWQKWIDTDDEEEMGAGGSNFDMGNFDMSALGGMSGMGGGMGGGLDNMDFGNLNCSDDSEDDGEDDDLAKKVPSDSCCGGAKDACCGGAKDACCGGAKDACCGGAKDACCGGAKDACCGGAKDACCGGDKDACCGGAKDACCGDVKDACCKGDCGCGCSQDKEGGKECCGDKQCCSTGCEGKESCRGTECCTTPAECCN